MKQPVTADANVGDDGYPPTADLKPLLEQVLRYAELKHERGSEGLHPVLGEARETLTRAVELLKRMPEDELLRRREPDDLAEIRALRPAGPRRMRGDLRDDYADRLEGAVVGRFAGCTLGAPVEFWTVERMRLLAAEHGDAFPPTDYWRSIPYPLELRYETSPRRSYLRGHIDGVPVDDDLVYTVLGLLILEDYGLRFSTRDVAQAWLTYLPFACTAEEIALANLRNGVTASAAGDTDNPYAEWIGASIRSDPWGYVCPGWPERAAELAHRDAMLSHRRQGVYAEMFFAATIGAAMVLDDPLEAVEVGLTEIPAESAFAQAIRWALDAAPNIRGHEQARTAVDLHFAGMHPTHAINNACLVVFGLMLGRRDVTRVIGQTVAMGLDNDCNAATAGSIVGAIVGGRGVPEHWTRGFNDTLYTYLHGNERLSIRTLLQRFEVQARRMRE
jgi:ADP-ribosylglycohydrolase